MSQIELDGVENESKKETDETIFFLKFNLKFVKTNRYKPKHLTQLNYTSCGSN